MNRYVNLPGGRIVLPPCTTDEKPTFVADDGTVTELAMSDVQRIRDWSIGKDAVEDVEYYINDLEENPDDEESNGITPDLIRENMVEIISYYLDRRFNADEWYNDVWNAVETFKYRLERSNESAFREVKQNETF